MFTFYVGRLCGGSYGLLFRWFGRAQVERFRVCFFMEGEGNV